MGLAFILAVAFPLLSLLHCAAAQQNTSFPTCLDNFYCNDHLGSFSFPYYNNNVSRCGFVRVDCNEQVPTIQLRGDARRYNIIRYDQIRKAYIYDRENHIVIRDNVFQKGLQSKSCDALNNLSFPKSPSITYSISPFLNLYKCNNSPEATILTDIDRHFDASYHRYRDCKDHILYYKYPVNVSDDLANIPNQCSLVQLPPIELPSLPPGTNYSALFSILSPEFTLLTDVSENCSNCWYHDQCQNQTEDIHCARYGDYIGSASAESQPAESRPANVGLIVGVVLGIVFFAMVFFYFIWKFSLCGKCMLLWWKKTERDQNIENFLKNNGSFAPKRYSYSNVKKMTNSFKEKLGQGGYGHVYKGKLCNGNFVAVKILKGSKGNVEDFINEVASISKTSHVNIVNLLGFCFEGHKRALIYEFMPNGSLEKFIYDGSSLIGRQLGWEKLYQIAVGIARGLEYLHRGCSTRILHFDIKPHNILLDEDFCPKITDFGLAKLCPGKESILSMVTARGTFGYIAPEVFCRNFGGVSYKSDVYSYGMMVSEMVGGRKNIDVEVAHTSEIYFPHWIYKQLESNNELGLHGIVNEEENEIARKMIIVSLWCIQTDPITRPSMTRVLEMLEGSLESLQIPPKPYLSSPLRSHDGSQTIDLI